MRHFLLEQRRSRIPIYDGSLDDIVGYASAKDIVSVAWDGKLVVLQDVLRPLKVFPETTAAIEVLRFMRRERQRVVVSVDERGLVSGLATFEDLIEELVGDISSEDDEGRQPIVIAADGSAIVRGEVPLRDVNRALDLHLAGVAGRDDDGSILFVKLGGGIPNRHARSPRSAARSSSSWTPARATCAASRDPRAAPRGAAGPRGRRSLSRVGRPCKASAPGAGLHPIAARKARGRTRRCPDCW